MTEAFSHRFDGLIWKMDIYEPAELLALEWRTTEGIPRFSVIHYSSGQLLADAISYGDRWWTLAAVTAHQVLLHHYPQPNQGQTSALAALSIDTGKILWERFNLQFQELLMEGIAVKQGFMGANDISVLDSYTGHTRISRTKLEKLRPLQRSIQVAQPTTDTPTIPLLAHTALAGPYFRATSGTREFWAYHVHQEKGFRLLLSVFDAGKIIFNECIVDQLHQLLPETFFLVNQQLFFIRNNKQEIVSYFV
ncbi:hypothetical protein GCM10023231_20560 [Olivibacter ginsenosidimutans]|uniref:DUF4905 domain-containing protein n=1 Tax=Olivibacter ginsenosidimutans TaxID=1176537 RepID=A0ABP9BCR7_9SPHI